MNKTTCVLTVVLAAALIGACGGDDQGVGYTEEMIFNTGSGALSFTCSHNPDNVYCSCSGSWDCEAMKKECKSRGADIYCEGLGSAKKCCCNSNGDQCDSGCADHSPPYGKCPKLIFGNSMPVAVPQEIR